MKPDHEVNTPIHAEDGEVGKNQANLDLVDNEVAQYVAESRVQIDEDTNKRLKRMIDKRILVIMVVTYFTQSLDRGTMSFASIMGIIQDANLAPNQVRQTNIEIWLNQAHLTGCSIRGSQPSCISSFWWLSIL
jgi:hypothetical protein